MCVEKEPSDYGMGLTPQNKVTYQWQEILFSQHENDIRPPAGKERKRSITKNPRIGGLPLIPIQHERNATEARRNIEVGYNFISFGLNIAFAILCFTVIQCIHSFISFK